MLSFSGVTFVLDLFPLLSLKPRPFVQSFFDMYAPRRLNTVTLQLSASFFVFVSLLFLLEMLLFPVIFG